MGESLWIEDDGAASRPPLEIHDRDVGAAKQADLHDRRMFLATETAGPREIRLATAGLIVSAVIFAAAVPFAARQLPHVHAFIPAYESALVISDLITAVLLFGQSNILRSRALFVLACGYLFTAFVAVAHALSFPDVFAPTGLLGAGPQTTIWLYIFWHAAFPLFVIAYSLLRDNKHETGGAFQTYTAATFTKAIALVVAASIVATAIAIVLEANLPVLIREYAFMPLMTEMIVGICGLCMVAIAVVLSRRPYSVLDLWLIVVMCAWIFDIALCGVFNQGRYDLGWYAGRIYGLLAANSLLIVLLIESASHYGRLSQLSSQLRSANKSLEQLSLQDGLTEIANRRSFDTYLAAQIAVARRHDRPVALILCDVDSFKAYNDHYGHLAGDQCLKQIAAALQACCRRPADMAARYGGEEFGLILPDTDLLGAMQFAEAARHAVAALSVPHARSSTAPFATISAGVVVALSHADASAAQLIEGADKALFQAKRQGRNRSVTGSIEFIAADLATALPA